MVEITEIPVEGYQCVKRAIDPVSGLHAFISVHSTVLGPALGGMRLWPYVSEDEALTDVLRLSRGMTYKAACAGLDLGGGKSVIIGDPSMKSDAFFEAMGEFVESFGGSYITAEDVNTKVEDMGIVARKSSHVVGMAGKSGNPSPKTAWGTFLGLKATLEDIYGSDSVEGKTVAIEGAGSVGSIYADYIAREGGKIIVADIFAESAERVAKATDGIVVGPDEIRSVECDIYAPCALGGSLNDETIPQLKCKAIVGAANNQLLEDRHGDMLRELGIRYAPDYVVNAAGLINVFDEMQPGGYKEERALAAMEKIRTNMAAIFAISNEEGISTAEAADRFAERRVQAKLDQQANA
ncbi:MAG: Glu/Leu/Phe/Val dehydrogenase dimerization domain-containing protein [Planctomycetota bacterium]|jgi:leucine dehydrogenase|nr:Glu/Leu/Phe/Val dehydrogenase dimerization domain-containing protein [Planctomycetota bacterium]